MHKLNAYVFAAVCCLMVAGCSGSSGNADSGTTTTTDSGQMTNTDAGYSDAGSQDAGPNCTGANGCYSCTPTTYVQLVNACTNAQSVTKNPTLPLLSDGGLPPLP